MFRSTTIIRELQCPCQSYYHMNTVVCMLIVVVVLLVLWTTAVIHCCGRLQSFTALARTCTPGTLLKHKLIQTI